MTKPYDDAQQQQRGTRTRDDDVTTAYDNDAGQRCNANTGQQQITHMQG